MATPKQIEANRRNALLSTGPRTPQGKAAVSLNSLRHGLRARRVVLPGESQEDFQQLCGDLEAEWQPQTLSEQFYVEQMAVSWWKLARMEVTEGAIYPLQLEGQKHVALLDRVWQAQSRMERSYARAQRELQRLQQCRPEPCVQPTGPPAEEVPAAPQPVTAPEAPSCASPEALPSPDQPLQPQGKTADTAAQCCEAAWTLATSPEATVRDGVEAVRLAQQLLVLNGGQEPEVFDTLAAAFAEQGRFIEAIHEANRALEAAARQNRQPLTEAIQARIKLYKACTPYREPSGTLDVQ
ncbi:MAG TPA: hypothetical protein VE959_22515 [Bryobacteraceae bacterium]|nr:hypothetical protein [Bryobacteraceae bacterium]